MGHDSCWAARAAKGPVTTSLDHIQFSRVLKRGLVTCGHTLATDYIEENREIESRAASYACYE